MAIGVEQVLNVSALFYMATAMPIFHCYFRAFFMRINNTVQENIGFNTSLDVYNPLRIDGQRSQLMRMML